MKSLVPYCAPPVPDKLLLRSRLQVHTFHPPVVCVAMHRFAFIKSDAVVHPARFLAVAGGSTTPTLLATGGKEYEESFRFTCFARPLHRGVSFSTAPHPEQKRQTPQKRIQD